MGKVRTSGCALVLLSSLVLSVSSALACTPAVFLFRHAEDTNPPAPLIFHLTPTGEFHASFYKIMVPAFADGTTFCKVTTVYAATTVDKPDHSRSATNSFFTAQPLAQQQMGKDPIIEIGPINDKRPEDSRLYEYLGNGVKAPSEKPSNYETEIAKRLRTALLATANKNESSAIFWTSQGLHVLGGVVIEKTSNVPDKNFPGLKYSGTPPRNAVYVFTAVGSAPGIAKFNDILLRPKDIKGVSNNPEVLAGYYVQCFNHVEYSNDLNPHPAHFVQDPVRFYCGYGGQSNLGGSPPSYSANPPKTCNYDASGKLTTICDGSIPASQNIKIDGKICNTTELDPNVDNSTGIYGACMP